MKRLQNPHSRPSKTPFNKSWLNVIAAPHWVMAVEVAREDDDRRPPIVTPTIVILSGDFNRHHPMWGGNHIQPRFIEDASDLITLGDGG
jgi:hypothetical protein